MRRWTAVVLAAALAAPATALGAADPLRPQQWNLDMVESDAAHQVATGDGAIVAVIDTGAAFGHPDLQGRLLAGKDYVDSDPPQDGNGHGTHVTGIVVATDGNGVGVSSVAPGAKVLPVRVLDDSGEGFTSDVAAGVNWAVDQGAHIINLSLSSEVPLAGEDEQFTAALDRALDRGVIVVAAAGNNGLPICENPSGEGRLLCVGAVDRRRQRSYYSSFGSGLGIVAPGGSGLPFTGEDVLSTYTSPEYEEVAGTSQATPHVAGVAALLVSKGIRGQAAVERILATASDAGPAGPDAQYGAGIVNARAAVAGLPSGGGGGSVGGGGGSGGGGGGTVANGSGAFVSVPRVQRIRTVLRRGILVRCRAAGSGRCTGSATAKRRRIARGARPVAAAGRTVSFRLRVTRTGRELLKRARRVRATVRVTLPGVAPVLRTVILKR
jgi:subtilisin family serine protease